MSLEGFVILATTLTACLGSYLMGYYQAKMDELMNRDTL